jgi:hypothetical protein
VTTAAVARTKTKMKKRKTQIKRSQSKKLTQFRMKASSRMIRYYQAKSIKE